MSTPRSLRASETPVSDVYFTGNARFELRRVLGEGSMGVVYEAYDHEREMLVALKTLRALDADALYRLKTEFRARVDLEHRNLVRLGELLHDDGHWFFTMELVDGWPFHDWVRNGPPGDEAPLDDRAAIEARLRDALVQLAHGLDALHRGGKVHRDLKPSNVLVTRKGRVVVLDFGLIAESAPGRHSGGADVVGTAAYMAPEQALSPRVSSAADVYSVGVMLYEALLGRLPFDGAPLEILLRKQGDPPPAPRGAGIPADLARLAMEMLARAPADRPSASQIVARLSMRALPEERRAFVGRVAELAQLEQALDEVTAGATATVFVEGESGIGKSALVRSFVDRVQEGRPGTVVLTARCYERESVPFKGIDGIVDSLTRELLRRHTIDVAFLLTDEVDALARVFPVLRRVPAVARMTVPSPASPVELRARAFRGLRVLLGALAAAQRMVVVIDDVQWADIDSLALLREVLHPPGAPQLLLVLTRRADAGPQPDLPGLVRTIRLGPLSHDEGRELVALLAPEREAEADALVDDADGHPMFLQELARYTAAPRVASPRFDDALWARVTRMEHRARRVLELIAVAGARLPQAVVGLALGLEPPTLSKLLGVLRAASLVRTGGTRGSDPVEPYHDRVREAVTARIPAPRRRRYHERLAGVLLATGVAEKEPLAVVLHLEASGAVEHAASFAQRAARRAEEVLAFERAAALWEVALRLGDHDPDTHRDLLLRRAEALGYAGCGPDAAAAFLAAADGAAPETGFQCRRLAAHELLISGHIHDGLALFRSVLAEVGERLPRSTRRAKLLMVWRTLRIAIRGTGFRERAIGDARANVDELRLDVIRSASLGLSMVDVMPAAAFQARAVLVALRLGDRRRIAYALTYHAMYLAASGALIPRARRLVARAREIAIECNTPLLLGWTRLGEGVAAFFAGEYTEAVEILLDAEAQLRDRAIGATAEIGHLRNFVLFALRRMGAYDQLREHQTEYVRDALRRGDRYAATTYVWSSNIVWVAIDDVARARADLASVSWSDPRDGLHLQHWFHVRAQLELALYEEDDAALARLEPAIRAFVGPEFAHLEAVSTESRYLLGRIALRRGDAAAARREVTPLRSGRAPYVTGFAYMVHAAAAVLDGDLDEARAALRRARADAERCKMAMLAGLAQLRLAELDGSAAALTEAEMALAACGIVDPIRFARIFATWPRGPVTSSTK